MFKGFNGENWELHINAECYKLEMNLLLFL